MKWHCDKKIFAVNTRLCAFQRDVERYNYQKTTQVLLLFVQETVLKSHWMVYLTNLVEWIRRGHACAMNNTASWLVRVQNSQTVMGPLSTVRKKMAAVHFTTIPCEPNKANRHTKSHIFAWICPCASNILYAKSGVFRTFLCVFMSVFRVLVR